jgi:hypothetical protein
MASKHKKLKGIAIAPAITERVHDRRATDLPLNAKVHIVEIDDPYEAGKKISAVRSLRGDVLALMRARGHIDEAQYRAGLQMQNYYEQAEIWGVRGIDLTKEFVDGGTFSDPMTEQFQRAVSEIARLEAALGKVGAALVRDVLCLGYSIGQSAVARGMVTERGIKWLGGRFRECIETLAIELNFVRG